MTTTKQAWISAVYRHVAKLHGHRVNCPCRFCAADRVRIKRYARRRGLDARSPEALVTIAKGNELEVSRVAEARLRRASQEES